MKILVILFSTPPFQALDTFENLERTVGADGYTLTAVIDVLRRLGDWRRALPLLERLDALGVPADRGFRTSINAVLSAMGPDNYHEARDLAARAAEEWGVKGDMVTYGTLLLAASEHLLLLPAPSPLEPQPDRGGEGDTVQILRLAASANAVPSESCLNMVMFGLARSGQWEEAAAFVEEVERAGRRVSRNQVGRKSGHTPGTLALYTLVRKPLFLDYIGLCLSLAQYYRFPLIEASSARRGIRVWCSQLFSTVSSTFSSS